MNRIDFDRLELPALFDLKLVEALSNTALGRYAYQYIRPDGISILLSMNVYEERVGLIVRTETVVISSLNLTNCTAIRVLDTRKLQFEILFAEEICLRIFVDLTGSSILAIALPDR